MEYMECDNSGNELFDFITLTNTSENFANDFLCANGWNLQVALNNFFESYASNIECPINRTFKVISWNIDGLDERFVDNRINSLLTIIKENHPDIVFLQEIVTYTENILRNTLLNEYNFFTDSYLNPYYCGILIRKFNQIKIISDLNVIKFHGSQMGRSLLTITVNIFGIDVKLMTSHLESMKDYSEERKIQLSTAFLEMKNGTQFSIFAGDMNVRDFELRQINSPPNNIFDVAEFLGDKSNLKPTWEPNENKNIAQTLSMIPGMRFDRMYFYSLTPDVLKPIEFEVLGKQLISDCNIHTSDHWAISGVFSL